MTQLSVNKLPWYGQLGLFVALALGAAGTFYYFYALPMQADFDARTQQLAALRVNIVKAQTTGRRLPEFQAQVRELEERLESLKPILPETKDYGDLMSRIGELARQSGVRIVGFKPMATVARPTHLELPVVLQVEGTYHNLGFFYDKVSRFPRIIHITDLNIKAKEPPTPTVTITADFTVVTFVLGAAPPAGAPAPAAK
jgi:type IV pilus assembly protein PilO